MNSAPKRFVSCRLCQKGDGSRIQGLCACMFLIVCRYEYDCDTSLFANQTFLQIKTAHARQSQIKDEAGRSVKTRPFQEVLGRREGADSKSTRLQEAFKRLAHHG